MNFLFFVPARGGSKGVKNKNTRTIGGETLVSKALSFLEQSDYADSTVLSSEDNNILKICKEKNIFSDRRPLKYATDEATTAATIQEFIDSGRWDKRLTKHDWVIIVEPTSPFRKHSTLEKIMHLIDTGEYDTIMTVYESTAVEWESLDNNEWKRKDLIDGALSRRQSRPSKYFEAGVFYATRVGCITSTSIVGKRCNCVVVDEVEAMDINTMHDLNVSRALWEEYKRK